MEIQGYKIHPLAQKVPEQTPSEYRQLKESMSQIGQTSPIISYQGEIADGRHRVKICLELGLTPWIKEYDGDKPIAQYILSTNIRRNLTRLQRQQLLADFATEIIPQIEAEMKERKKRKSASANSVPEKSPEQNCQNKNRGRQTFMDATGATEYEAQQIKSIHDKAPELLAEVAQHGGLIQTEKEARRRINGAPKQRPPKQETAAQRVLRSMQLSANAKSPLTKEQVDPDFKGTPTEFADKYGYVQIRTKAQMESEREQAAFSAWVGAIRSLRMPLENYLKGDKFKPENFHTWIKKAPSKEKRIAEINELACLIIKTRESIEWLLPLLEAEKTRGDGVANPL